MKPILPPSDTRELNKISEQITASERNSKSFFRSTNKVVVSAVGVSRPGPATKEMRSSLWRPHSPITVRELRINLGAETSEPKTFTVLVDGTPWQTVTLPDCATGAHLETEARILNSENVIQVISDDLNENEAQWVDVQLVGDSQNSLNGSMVVDFPEQSEEEFDDTDPGSARIGPVRDIVVDSEGRYLIAGGFTTAAQQPANNLVRLNSDGSKDESFDVGVGPNASIRKVLVQSDGKILCSFRRISQDTTWNGIVFPDLVRLNVDGTLDDDFKINDTAQVSRGVRDFTLLPDDKIVCLEGNGLDRIVILNPDGTFFSRPAAEDYSFSGPSAPTAAQTKFDFVTAADQDTLIIWGNEIFTGNYFVVDLVTLEIKRTPIDDGNFDGIGELSVASAIPKQLSDGQWIFPTRFKSESSIGGVLKVAQDYLTWEQFPDYDLSDARNVDIDSSNRIVLGGWSLTYEQNFVGSVIRMDANGVFDTTFDASTAISQQADPGINPQKNRRVEKVVCLPDGKILVGGNFTTTVVENRVNRQNFVRLNSDGTLDTTLPAI